MFVRDIAVRTRCKGSECGRENINLIVKWIDTSISRLQECARLNMYDAYATVFNRHLNGSFFEGCNNVIKNCSAVHSHDTTRDETRREFYTHQHNSCADACIVELNFFSCAAVSCYALRTCQKRLLCSV